MVAAKAKPAGKLKRKLATKKVAIHSKEETKHPQPAKQTMKVRKPAEPQEVDIDVIERARRMTNKWLQTA